MKNKWTKIILENAIKLHENGLTFAEIAVKLNRTEKAVKVKLGRIGFKQNKPEYYETINCFNCGWLKILLVFMVNFIINTMKFYFRVPSGKQNCNII